MRFLHETFLFFFYIKLFSTCYKSALRCKNEKNEKCDKNIKQSDLSGEKWKKISYFVRILKIRSR